MKKLILIMLLMIILSFSMDLKSTYAQEIREIFNKVNPSVMVMKTLQIVLLQTEKEFPSTRSN